MMTAKELAPYLALHTKTLYASFMPRGLRNGIRPSPHVRIGAVGLLYCCRLATEQGSIGQAGKGYCERIRTTPFSLGFPCYGFSVVLWFLTRKAVKVANIATAQTTKDIAKAVLFELHA